MPNVYSTKKRIYLVNPASGRNVAGLTECIDLLGYRYLCANLSLPTIAALVDENQFSISICDENTDQIDFDFPCDIVGLSIYHYQRERTYQIAEEFRRRGKLVVAGGPFATQNLQNGHPLFDVVFVGEAERTWPEFLKDYLQGSHKSYYREYEHPDITQLRPPRFDLMHNERYLLGPIQISRGCPYRCDFCSCTVLYGREMRYKTDIQVISELNQLHRLGYRALFILDDNFSGDRSRCREILEVIRDWNNALKEPVIFSTSASIDIANPVEFAQLFSQAMVTNIFVGIETPNKESLAGAMKYQNLKTDTISDIKTLHSVGIDVAAGLIVGFDNDDCTIFRRQVDFIQEASIPVCFAGMLLAPDGTVLKERLIREGRYLGNTVARDHTFETNVVPKLMSIEELRLGYFWMMNRLYDETNYLNRIRGILRRFPEPHPLMKRFRPREMRKPLVFAAVVWRLLAYYMTNGFALRTMLIKVIPLLIRHRKYASTIIYWLIELKHFQQMLRYNGAFKNVSEPGGVSSVVPSESRTEKPVRGLSI